MSYQFSATNRPVYVLLKAHLEIDHVEGSATVLNKAVMTDLLMNIAREYKCEVYASKSSQGGNRAHVFTDLRMVHRVARGIHPEPLESYLALDDSTSRSRVIRAPFARSPKAHRRDQYTLWLVYAHAKNFVCDAAEMEMTIGDWIHKAIMNE
ncbi:hypothetical protein T492DRAFT_1128126 [Pavlovales sp. CCMP2436]|nr:hypothetical protein T492DRAFT_1128126 [Pavlovales sp. CCMP2436]